MITHVSPSALPDLRPARRPDGLEVHAVYVVDSAPRECLGHARIATQGLTAFAVLVSREPGVIRQDLLAAARMAPTRPLPGRQYTYREAA